MFKRWNIVPKSGIQSLEKSAKQARNKAESDSSTFYNKRDFEIGGSQFVIIKVKLVKANQSIYIYIYIYTYI